MDAFLNKKYKLSTSDNFDEFLKVSGVGMVPRGLAKTISPDAVLKKEGDEYILCSYSTFKNVELRFKLGVQLDYETPDGRKVKATFTVVNGTTLKEEIVGADGKNSTIERTFSADELKIVMKIDDVVSTRIYKPKE